jgi:hypothetical protein
VTVWLLVGAYIWQPSIKGGSSALPTYDVNCDVTDVEQRIANFEEMTANNTKYATSNDNFFFVPDG